MTWCCDRLLVLVLIVVVFPDDVDDEEEESEESVEDVVSPDIFVFFGVPIPNLIPKSVLPDFLRKNMLF